MCGRHYGLGYPRQMVVEANVEQRPITRRTMKTTCSPAKVLTVVTAMMLAGSLAGCDAAASAFEIIEPTPASPPMRRSLPVTPVTPLYNWRAFR